MTPIWDGVRPFFANLKICSLTSSEDSFSHVGTLRRYGSADWDIPLLKIRYDTTLKMTGGGDDENNTNSSMMLAQ